MSFNGFSDQGAAASGQEGVERRTERAAFETDRHLIVGDITLPPAGYQSRFSDAMNRPEVEFISLTGVEITSLSDGRVTERPFIVLARSQVRLAYPLHA